MRVTATRLLCVALLCAALGATSASAQVPLSWDHYKMYIAPAVQPPSGFPTLLLTDQWGQYSHQLLHLEYWWNPVEKTVNDPPPVQVFPINNAFLHYTWWRISPQYNEKLVAVTNQFGDQTLYVKDAEWLLAPALKNQSGSPPTFNHYKCYSCEGPPVNKPVHLRDQFDFPSGAGIDVQVQYPRWFCNPVAKQVAPPAGPSYPIVNDQMHYVCYDYVPPDPLMHSIVFYDQFYSAPIDVGPSYWLCVPSFKNGFTSTTRGSWGKLKTLYR